MPEYNYEALAGTGKRTTGTVTANSEREVVSMLDAKELFPLRIEPVRAGGIRLFRGGPSVGSRTMATFF